MQYALPGTVQVDGGTQWQYSEPIRPGDRITQFRKIIDVYERQGSAGPLLFIITNCRFVNQFDETAVTMTGVTIRYEPGRAKNAARTTKRSNGRATVRDSSVSSTIKAPNGGRFAEGAEIGPFIKHTSTQDLVKYAGASRDFSEIHYDKDFAIGVGLPGRDHSRRVESGLSWKTDDRLAGRSRRAEVIAMPTPRYGLPIGVWWNAGPRGEKVRGGRTIVRRL